MPGAEKWDLDQCAAWIRPHLTFVQGREFNFPTQHTPKAISGPIGRYPCDMQYAAHQAAYSKTMLAAM